MTNTIQLLIEHACFGGVQRFYRHDSHVIGLPMRFSGFLPPAALAHDVGKVAVLMYLVGLSCNEETVATKAGAHRRAAELGPDSTKWTAHDASALMSECSGATYPDGILIDQGLADKFCRHSCFPSTLKRPAKPSDSHCSCAATQATTTATTSSLLSSMIILTIMRERCSAHQYCS